LNFFPLPQGQGSFLPLFFIMQLRYKTDLSFDEYVQTQAWEQVVLGACPFHPHGGCNFSRHGVYLRKFPQATMIPRWYCPQEHQTVSMLPDFFASRLPGTLNEVEQAVNVAELSSSLEEAAEALRPDITLPSALRWLRRRINYVEIILVTVAGLILPGCPADLGSFRKAFSTEQVLVELRGKAATHLQSLPPILGFGPRLHGRWPLKMRRQQSMGPD
jgi:hypothetical protein